MRDQARATPEELLQGRLYLLLVRAGHAERLTGIACARNRRDSVVIDQPGFTLRPTTLKGQPAWYVAWEGPEPERAGRLVAYQRTLEGAGWPTIPVAFWPNGNRVRSQLHWAPPTSGATVGLLVASPAAATKSEQ